MLYHHVLTDAFSYFSDDIIAFRASALLVGRQEGWGAGVVVSLQQIADLHMAQLMPMPLTLSSVLFFSRPRSEGWPHHGRTFSIYPCPLSF